MKIKKKTLKRVIYAIIIIAIIWVGYIMFSTPDYDHPLTPKPTFGNPDATVKIVEFADMQCPACRSAHFELEKIKTEFEDQISYQYFHFPLRSIHPFAQKAAEGAECANDQGKFFEFIDTAYKNQENLRTKDLKIYAGKLGMDQKLFDACLDSSAKKDVVQIDWREGDNRNIRGTPTIFLNGEEIDWQNGVLKAAIEKELKK